MKALKVLYVSLKDAQSISDRTYIQEAIDELLEYEQDMDKYLDYTTNGKCSKSFGSYFESIKTAHDITVDEIVNYELKTKSCCETCKHWYEKSCMNLDGIAYGGTNAVYEDDYCKDYEEKLTY